jgi:hypothetical protein
MMKFYSVFSLGKNRDFETCPGFFCFLLRRLNGHAAMELEVFIWGQDKIRLDATKVFNAFTNVFPRDLFS